MYQISQEHLDALRQLLNDVTEEVEAGGLVGIAASTLEQAKNILAEVSKGGKTTLDVDVGHGYISAERTFADGGLEAGIVIGVKDYSGMWLQDLVMAEHPFEDDEDGNVVLKDHGFNCYLWGDSDREDYTEKRFVTRYVAPSELEEIVVRKELHIRQVSATITSCFEDVLDTLNIRIPDEDRTGDEGEAAIYGCTYAAFEDGITELLASFVERVRGGSDDTDSVNEAIYASFESLLKQHGFVLPSNMKETNLAVTERVIQKLLTIVKKYPTHPINTWDY